MFSEIIGVTPGGNRHCVAEVVDMKCCLIRIILVILGSALPGDASSFAEDARELLKALAQRYPNVWNERVFEGEQSFTLPDNDCVVRIPFEWASDTSSSGETLRRPSVHHAKPKTEKQCHDAALKIAGFGIPTTWAELGSADVGIKTLRGPFEKVLRLPEGDIRCRVLEVEYEEYYEKIWKINGPRRYWIDMDTGFLRRVEFNEVTDAGVRRWVVTIHKMSERSSVPPEAAFKAPSKLVGNIAPNLNLRTSEGKAVELAGLRGNVVVLVFWATWCGPCLAKIPFLEKLQSEVRGSRVLILGVSDENQAVVGDWMMKYGRSFKTVVDGKAAFRAFGVEPIPTTIVIGKDGTLMEESVGSKTEAQMRELIAKYL